MTGTRTAGCWATITQPEWGRVFGKFFSIRQRRSFVQTALLAIHDPLLRVSQAGLVLVYSLLGEAQQLMGDTMTPAPLNSPEGRWNLLPEVPSKNPEGRAGRKSPRDTPTHGMSEAQKEQARSAATSPKAKASPPSPDSTKAQAAAAPGELTGVGGVSVLGPRGCCRRFLLLGLEALFKLPLERSTLCSQEQDQPRKLTAQLSQRFPSPALTPSPAASSSFSLRQGTAARGASSGQRSSRCSTPVRQPERGGTSSHPTRTPCCKCHEPLPSLGALAGVGLLRTLL
ncbi:unnamed protein product [Eretmochelys imbricata]